MPTGVDLVLHRLGQSRDIRLAESLHIVVVLLLRSFYQQNNLLVHPTETVHLSVFQLICQVIETTVLLPLHTYPPWFDTPIGQSTTRLNVKYQKGRDPETMKDLEIMRGPEISDVAIS